MTKEEKIEKLIDYYSDSICFDDLIDYFRNGTYDFLSKLNDDEINKIFKNEIE